MSYRVIKDIRVLRENVWVECDLVIEAGLITSYSAKDAAQSSDVTDGKGMYCFPGAVDLHVHFNEPGRTEWEGFATGSAAAVAGGITYLADMPLNCLPSTVNVDALKIKLNAIEQKSYTDFGLWGGVVPGNVKDLVPLAKAGVMGFKAFMSPSGNDDFENSGSATLHEAMQEIAGTGLRLALHAEDPAVLDQASRVLAQRESAADWLASRPIESEIEAVRMAIELSKQTACPITIVHVSASEVLDLIDEAKAEGVDILCETCPHYLLLSSDDASSIGANAKCAPPLRLEQTRASLVESLLSGRIDTVGSDHSPSPPELKAGKSFFEAWGGIAGIQHGLALLIDHLGLDATEPLSTLQHAFATNPALVADLERKGSLEVGNDADFFLLRPQGKSQTITAESLLHRNPISAYIGRDFSFDLQSTFLRGEEVYRNGKVVTAPRGEFIKGKAFQE